MDMLLKPRIARRSLVMRLAGGAPGIAPIYASRLFEPVTLTRAQVSAFSTALAVDDATWREFGADAARFNGAAQRLVIGGQRTNLHTDPRLWASSGVSNATITATSGPDGGAATASQWTETGALGTRQRALTTVAVTNGLTYAVSALVRAGTCSSCQLTFPSAQFGLNAWGNFDLTGTGAVGTSGGALSRHTIRRFGAWHWIEAAAPATATGSGAPLLFMTPDASAVRAVSYTGTGRTLDVAWAQIEEAAFASMFILPPVGAPGASTRGADLVSAPLSGFSVGGNGACTVLWTGMIPQAAGGADQTLLQLDDGTDNNRFRIRNLAGGLTIVAGRVTGGASADTASAGSMTAGTPFRAGVSIDGAGRIAASFNGGAAVAATGGPTTGLTTLRVGNNAGATAALFGEVATLRVVPVALSDADLAARVATFTG